MATNTYKNEKLWFIECQKYYEHRSITCECPGCWWQSDWLQTKTNESPQNPLQESPLLPASMAVAALAARKGKHSTAWWEGSSSPWPCLGVVVVWVVDLDGNVDTTLDQGVVVKVEVAIQGIERVGEDCQLEKARKVVGHDLQGCGAQLNGRHCHADSPALLQPEYSRAGRLKVLGSRD